MGFRGSIPSWGTEIPQATQHSKNKWASLVAQLVKNPPAMWETWGRSLGWEDRSPGEGKGYPLPYSGLENSMECIVHGVAKSQTQLSNLHFTDTTSTHHARLSLPCLTESSQLLCWKNHQLQGFFPPPYVACRTLVSQPGIEPVPPILGVLTTGPPSESEIAQLCPTLCDPWATRQKYWSGLPFPSPGDLPDSGIEPRSPTLQADALTSAPPGKPLNTRIQSLRKPPIETQNFRSKY